MLESRYPNRVPLCIVVYHQRCLEILSKRRIHWNDFVGNDKNEMIGRQSLLDIIKTVNTFNDYIGVFWSPNNCSKIRDEFVPQPLPQSSFNRVLLAATFPEAVDEMVCISL